MTVQLQICSYRQYLFNLLKNKFPKATNEDIEDCVQNSLIKAIRHSDKFKNKSSLKTWLSIITLRMYIDTFRVPYSKKEYLLTADQDQFIFENIPVDDFSETFCNSDHLSLLVDELMSGYEQNELLKTFKLHILDDINYKDIAIQQNIPIGTVKSRIFKARKLLQEKYRAISHKYDEITV